MPLSNPTPWLEHAWADLGVATEGIGCERDIELIDDLGRLGRRHLTEKAHALAESQDCSARA